MTQQNLPQCVCGYTRESYNKQVSIQIRQEYSFLGIFCLLVGVSAIPKKIYFSCFDCEKEFDVEVNPNRKFLKENI